MSAAVAAGPSASADESGPERGKIRNIARAHIV